MVEGIRGGLLGSVKGSAIGSAATTGQLDTGRSPSFEEVLQQATGKLRFSQHAQQRLRARGISLGAGQLQKLEAAVTRAAAKGGQETLILLGDLALVVSIPHRTVITVIQGDQLRESVFTNIDSAVIS